MTKGLSVWRYFSLAIALIIGGVSIWAIETAVASGVDSYRPQFAYVVREVSPTVSHQIIEQSITSEYEDPSLALLQNHIQLFKEDGMNRFPDRVFGLGGVIVIKRAPVIHLTDGKIVRDIRSWAPTVSDALKENTVPDVGQDDRVTPDVSSAVAHDMQVVIVRVKKTTVVETEKIPLVTIQKDDSTIERGKTIIKQAGHDGVKQKSFAVTREDGIEVSRVLTKTEITTVKEDRLVLNGTKLVIGKTISGTASWYRSSYNAASNQFKRGTDVRITNLQTKKSVEVKIDDFMEGTDKVIDLNPALFTQLGGALSQGVQTVTVEEVLN